MCIDSICVGDLKFEYYVEHQPLSTLNATSVRHPIQVYSVPGPLVVGCGESVDVVAPGPVPPTANFLVVTAVQDTACSFNTPAKSRMWQQDPIQPATVVPPEIPAPSVPVVYPSYPNPMSQECKITFDLAGSGHVELHIIDAAGRVVRHLIEASIPAGSHRITWDGRNDSGERVASGAYFSRLRAGEKESISRMILVE
jgi:hypothetical protein